MKKFDIVRIIIIVFYNKGNRGEWFQLHTKKPQKTKKKIDKWNKLHDSWWMIGWGVKCITDYFDESHLHDKKLCVYFGIVNWIPIPVDVQWSKLIILLYLRCILCGNVFWFRFFDLSHSADFFLGYTVWPLCFRLSVCLPACNKFLSKDFSATFNRRCLKF